MASLWSVANAARKAARMQTAVTNPERFARNRAKSYALRRVGFWRAWSRFWRI